MQTTQFFNNPEVIEGIYKGIKCGIGVCAVLGLLFLLIAWFNLTLEKQALEAVLKRYAPPAKTPDNASKDSLPYRLTKKDVEEITRGLKAEFHGNLTYRRLQVIADMVGSSGSNKNLTPQMSDLHQLSEQSILSHWSPTILRLITTTLLIWGICGTLWGVHHVILNKGLTDLSNFADALEPSKWAVLAAIILTLLRGLYTAAVDRFLWRLDRETMVHFLPDLIPNTELGEQATKLANAINRFNEKVGMSMEPIKDASRDIQCKAQKVFDIVDQISGTEEKLDGLLDQFSQTCTAVSSDQAAIQNELQSARSGIQNLDSVLGTTRQLNATLLQGIQNFQSSLQQVSDTLNTCATSMDASTQQAQSLIGQAGALAQELGSLGSVNQETQRLSTTITDSVTANKNAYSFFTAKLNEASRAINVNKESISDLAIYTKELAASAQAAASASQNAIQGAQEVRAYAQGFQTNIQSRDGEISQAHSLMTASQKQLDAEAQRVKNILQNILKEARELNDRLPRTPGGSMWHTVKRFFEKLFRR